MRPTTTGGVAWSVCRSRSWALQKQKQLNWSQCRSGLTQVGPQMGSRSPWVNGQCWGWKWASPVHANMSGCPYTQSDSTWGRTIMVWMPIGGVLDGRECTLAPPGKYEWIVHVRWQCGLMSNYFDHLLLLCSTTDRKSLLLRDNGLTSSNSGKPRTLNNKDQLSLTKPGDMLHYSKRKNLKTVSWL